MSGILFFTLGLLVSYLFCRVKPIDKVGCNPLLIHQVEKLLRYLAEKRCPENEEMLRLTRESVALGCDLRDLLLHYTAIDPSIQAMRPRECYSFGDMTLSYLYDYVPQRGQYLPEEKTVAQMLYQFKEGEFTQDILQAFVLQLRQQGVDQQRYMLICMPASTRAKTYRRYEHFSDTLSRAMGWEDGFGAIMPIDHDSQHHTGNRFVRDERHYHIDYKRLNGKQIILLDDVFTTGNSLLSLYGIVRRAGGYPAHAIFLCRTVQLHRLIPIHS